MWKRIALAVVALIAVLVVGTFAFFHTDYGRGVLKRQIEQRLAAAVTGTVTIGALEGTPFSTLVLRDLRIAYADGHPALRIETLRADLAILPLFGKRFHFAHLVAEGVTLAIARDPSGKLELGKLLKKKAPSAWALELPDIEIERGEITGAVALDGIVIHGRFARGPHTPMSADLAAYGALRDRGPVFASVALRMDRENQLHVPAALVTVGGTLAAAFGVAVGEQTGVVLVDAPRDAAQALAGIDLRDRVTVLAAVSPEQRVDRAALPFGDATLLVDAAGMFGASPVRVVARVDLAARRVRGMAVAGDVAVPRGRAGGVATFDVSPGEGLPIGTAFATVWTELAGMPRAQLGLAIASDGATAGVALDGVVPGTRFDAGGVVSRVEKRVSLVSGRLLATSTELPGTTGTVRADLRGSGALWPEPDLALAGAIDATNLRGHGLSAASAHLQLDAAHLPARPSGSADLRIANLAHGATLLGALAASVRTRSDGRLAVAIDSRGEAARWLLQLDALVAIGSTIDIALGHHAVRVGGAAWAGAGGRIAVSPARIAITGLRSASPDGAFALDATLQRRTREATIALTATSPNVDALAISAAFALPARLRDPAAWRAAVHALAVKATGIHAEPSLAARFGIATALAATIDLTADVANGTGTAVATIHQLHGHPLARPIDIRIAATSTAGETRGTIALRGPGGVNLGDLALAIPQPIERIRRTSSITGTLALTTAPAPMFAMLVGHEQLTGGLVSGTIAVAGTLAAPELAGSLVGTQLAVASPRTLPIDRLVLRGTYRGGELDATVDGAERDGGTLHLAARGRPDAPDELSLALVATRFDLAPVLALVPGRAAGGAGRVEANLAMHGIDPRTARFSGELHVTGGRVPLSPSIGTLRDARFDATIANDTVRLALACKLGGGALTARGTFSLAERATDLGRIDIQLRKVSPIGVLQPVIDADVTARVHRDAKRWIADVVIDHGSAVTPRRHGVPLAPIGGPDEMRLAGGARVAPHAKAKQLPEEPTMVANITIHPLRIDDEIVHGVVIGQLTTSNARDAFGVIGTVTSVHGDLDVMGRRYLVDRGALHFDGGTDALLDLAISHTDADVRTSATIRGRLSSPVVAMSAQPGVYTQGELVGSSLAPIGDPRDVAARDRATAAGETTVASEVGARFRGNLPLNVLRYESATAANSAAVTAGAWLSHALFLAYRRHLEARPDENVGEGDIEYWLGQRLSLDGTLGDRGYHGIDLLWRRRY